MTHEPVMVREVLSLLEPRPGGLYCDGTLGAGGHARALLSATAPDGRLLALDRDLSAVERARRELEPYGDRIAVVHGSFARLGRVLEDLDFGPLDGLLVDLGISSTQLDDPERGFSFQREGPIDMRMDRASGETAAELIERLSEEELADLIYTLGDERHSRRVARQVRAALEAGELRTTADLARAARRGVGAQRSGGIDAATRTFQALRLAVNDEIGQLRALLAALPGLLAEGGRVALISFHSLEDRAVKRGLRHWAGCRCAPRAPACSCGGPILRLLTRKPVRPTDEEVERNPRARSARLRAAQRVSMPEAA